MQMPRFLTSELGSFCLAEDCVGNRKPRGNKSGKDTPPNMLQLSFLKTNDLDDFFNKENYINTPVPLCNVLSQEMPGAAAY